MPVRPETEDVKEMNPIAVRVNADTTVKPFNHFFRATGYANVDYTYTPPTLRMYDYLSSFEGQMVYMRLHNILTCHGLGDHYFKTDGTDYGNPRDSKTAFDSVVSMDDKGNLSYNWETVDKVYDIFVEHGMKAIVETVYMPSCLRPNTTEDYRDSPSDFSKWGKVIEDFVRHLVDRYGEDEIAQWYFEIWNEPDGKGEFTRNPETLFALYDYMAHSVKTVSDRFRTGGPATMQNSNSFRLFEQFLSHCAYGVNYATGRRGSPLDFISVHCKGGKPWGMYSPSIEQMFSSLDQYANIIKGFPQFADLEFFNDESDIVWAGNVGVKGQSWLNFRNTHYFPGFVCKMVDTYCRRIEDAQGLNLTIVDSDNCHLQWERSFFSGNRSQFTPLVEYGTTDILKKPAFNAYVLLSRLGNKRVEVACEERQFGKQFGVLPTIDDNALAIMAWNFEDGMEDDINPRTFEVDCSGIPFSGAYKLLHYRIDQDHSSSYGVWKRMGKPQQPSIEQIREIREHEGLELFEPVRDITLTDTYSISLELPMHAISLLLFVPENSISPAQPTMIKAVEEEGVNGNRQIFLKWSPNKERDFLHYRLLRGLVGGTEESIAEYESLNTATYIDMTVDETSAYSYRVQAINASGMQSALSAPVRVMGDSA